MKEKSNKKMIRRILDIAMTILLFVLMSFHYTGQMWHEITGATMFVLLIVHHVMNRNWYKSLGKGRYSATRVLVTVVDIVLTIDILCLMLSGIAMSKYVFCFINLPFGMTLARSVHLIAAYLGFLLMSFHIGLHMGALFSKIWKAIPRRFIKVIVGIAVSFVFIYGAYALIKRNFFGYIFGSMTFAYFDYSELPVYFILDYVAILFFMIMLALFVKKLCTSKPSINGLKDRIRRIKNNIKEHKVRYLIIAGIIVIVVVLFFVFGGRTYIRRHYRTVGVDTQKVTGTALIDMNGKNGIIVYFTRVGNTNFDKDVDAVSGASLMEEDARLIGNSELLSEMLENATGFPSYAIKVKNKYSSSYNATIMEAKEEMDKGTGSELIDDVPDLSEYDTVILVYPLWWWTLPMPVQTFLNENDLSGKTIYSLVTHGGSGYGSALDDTKKYTAATVSNITLEVYDDDVVDALPQVVNWAKRIAEDR